MCITHLPQLAGFADQHFNVIKRLKDGRTQTELVQLEGGARQTELAQMLGTVGNGTMQSADEILIMVKKRKSQLQDRL